MPKALLSILLFIALSNIGNAQQAHHTILSAPLQGTTIFAAIDDKYNAEVFSLEMPDPDGSVEQERLNEIKRKMALRFPHKAQRLQYNKTTSVPLPVVALSFVSDSSPGIPPDNYIAANNNDSIVMVMNNMFTIHNGTNGQFTGRKNIKTLSASAGVNGLFDDRFDPKIIFDPETDRYIMVMLNLIFSNYNDSYIILGFSKTNSPSGAWSFYKLPGNPFNDSTFFDYPCLSITHNELFITGNKVRNGVSWQTGFKESVIYQIKKQDGYNGSSSLTYQLWDSIMYNGTHIRNLYPVKGSGSIAGPTQYFLGNRILDVQNDTVFMVSIPDTLGSINNNIMVNALQANIPYGVPPNGRQPDTAYSLMTNDGRILAGFINNDEIQFLSQSIDTLNGASGLYHGIISNVATTPSLHANLYSIDTLDFGYPNLSYTAYQASHNQSIISFNYTGPHTNPSYGALFFDGNNYSPLLNIKSGDSSIHMLAGNAQRWGDYSGSQPVWNAPAEVWCVGISGRKDHNYGCYAAKLASPYPSTVIKPLAKEHNAVLYPNPAIQYMNFKFNLTKEEPVYFMLYDMQGKFIDNILSQACNEGTNVIRFSIQSLREGTYIFKAQNSNGEIITSQTFTKQ
jgi:Secretion system C-terminal sorting domain